jgi:hypothetical protein
MGIIPHQRQRDFKGTAWRPSSGAITITRYGVPLFRDQKTIGFGNARICPDYPRKQGNGGTEHGGEKGTQQAKFY